jgi:hypothetical protein
MFNEKVFRQFGGNCNVLLGNCNLGVDSFVFLMESGKSESVHWYLNNTIKGRE